jgi:dihydroorotase
LRTIKDVTAIREGLNDGTIDAIASDHAPHALTDKEVEFEYAASGITGLETSLALCLRLVDDSIITLNQLLLKISTNPAKILNIPKGTLKIGADADITVIDLDNHWTVDRCRLRSKGKNTPFNGWAMKGKAIMTIMGGIIKHQEGIE